MLAKLFLLSVCLQIGITNAALLFWSNQKLEITPLAPFDDGDLESLLHKLGNPTLYKFKVQLKDGNQINKLENVKEVLKGYHSAYNPNGNIGTADAVELEVSEECHGIDTAKISKVLSEVNDKSNFLAVIDISSTRQKRDVETKAPDASVKADTATSVFYSATNAKTGKLALLYSTGPLILKYINGDKNVTYNLSTPVADGVSFSDSYLKVKFAVDEGKNPMHLTFNFTLSGGYWYLPNVKLEYFVSPTVTDNLNITSTKIYARSGFSYHCGSNTVFKSAETKSTLRISGLQIQVNANKEKFSDAYDCVGFTSIPIWSGIFITAILGVMMIVAITAMMDIKTMDRFDNYKTKNLAINVID